MTFFRVSNSNLSAAHLGDYLQNKYRFDDTVTCRIIRSGINDTYLIEDRSNKYIFRVYSLNWRSRTEIDEEIRLLNLLHESGIPVSFPIANSNNNYVLTFEAPEGQRFGLMFSYAKGDKRENNLSEDMHYQAGELMARFHAITHNLQVQRTTYNADTLLLKPFDQLSTFLPSHSEEWQFMRSVQQLLFRELNTIKTDQLRHGAVHLDIWADNFNIDANDAITLFDFDFCGNGWLCLDMAYYLIQLYNVEQYDLACKPKVDSFLAGYESITKLTDEEKRILPQLGIALNFFYLGIQCQRFDNWSNRFLNETYLKRYINGVVKKYYEIQNLSQMLNLDN